MDLAKYVGQDVLVAKHGLKRDYPQYEIQILATDEAATMEIRGDRIRVYYDKVSKLVEGVEQV